MGNHARIIAALAAACILPVHPAKAGVGDPLMPLYFFPGVRDDGGAAATGVATSIHCSNFSGTTEKIEYVVLQSNGSFVLDNSLNIDNGQTITVSTHDTNIWAEDLFLNTGLLNQGVIGVYATSNVMVCTAQVVDAAAVVPNGINLHGMRLNPVAGTTE